MIPTDAPHLVVVSRSHAGETGKNNEDAYAVATHRLERDGTLSILAIVADGVGGHRAGEIAANMAVDVVRKRVGEASGLEPIPTLRSAIIEAGRAVSTASESFPERQGMASTIAVAWILGRRLYTAYAGDSRIYLRRGGRIQQTTVDHSWVQEALEHNIITPDEAPHHPHAHILRRYLGGNLDPQPDFRLRLSPSDSDRRALGNQGVTLAPGDQVLLCSDGLTDLVSDDEIGAAIAESPPEEATASLEVLARARGGHDNITTILIAIPPVEAKRGRARRRVAAALIGVPGLILLVLLAVLGLLWAGLWPWG